MKPFFLYISAGLLSLYVLFFGSEFGISEAGAFSDSIIIAFTICFFAAANISLFRKKAAAVAGIAAFCPVLIWTFFLAVNTVAGLGVFQWAVLVVLVLIALAGYAVLYSLKSLFFTNELKWNTDSEIIYILRLILILIQLCIFWVIYNQG